MKSNQIGIVTAAKFAEIEGKYAEIYPQMTEEQRRIRALTAEGYWVPSLRASEAMLTGGGSAYVYLFELTEAIGPHAGNAYHRAELDEVLEKPRSDAHESVLGKGMHPAWVAFIRGEDPVGPGLPKWPQYRLDTRPTMIFDTESRVEMKPQEAELRLWDGLL